MKGPVPTFYLCLLCIVNGTFSQSNINYTTDEAEREMAYLDSIKSDDVKYKSILVVYSYVEHLEKEFLPDNFRNPPNRFDRWVAILNSGNPRVTQTLNEVLLQYPGISKTEAIETFARCIHNIFGDSTETPLRTVDRNILEILRNKNGSAAKDSILDALGVPQDQKYEKAIEIISLELDWPKFPPIANQSRDDIGNIYKCVVILPSIGDFYGECANEDKDVYNFFPTQTPQRVVFKRGTNYLADSFIVEFEDCFSTFDAVDNNLGWLKSQKVKLKSDDCSRLEPSTVPR